MCHWNKFKIYNLNEKEIYYKKEWKEKYDKKDTHDNVLVTLNCYSFKPIAYRGREGNWGYFNLQKA